MIYHTSKIRYSGTIQVDYHGVWVDMSVSPEVVLAALADIKGEIRPGEQAIVNGTAYRVSA